jgi:hypothetical protein
MTKRSKKPHGRPSKYKPEYDDQAYRLCMLGFIDRELAEYFGTTEQTINNWKKDHPTFFESLVKGREGADERVAMAVFKNAVGYEHPETKVFCQDGKIIEHDVVKHYQPNPKSQEVWLRNRRGRQWNKAQEKVQVSGDADAPVKIDHNVALDAESIGKTYLDLVKKNKEEG